MCKNKIHYLETASHCFPVKAGPTPAYYIIILMVLGILVVLLIELTFGLLDTVRDQDFIITNQPAWNKNPVPIQKIQFKYKKR